MSLKKKMISWLRRVETYTRRKIASSKIYPTQVGNDCLKWGVVGTGYMASVWADVLIASGNSKLHAVCSRTLGKAEVFARKFGGAKAFGELSGMLSELARELDFVYVATPLSSHFSIIKMCIKAGVNVLTEKPAVRTSAEWLELVALAREHRVLLIEGMWMRCLPTFQQADRWFNEGEIGELRWIRVDLQKFQPADLNSSRPDEGVLMDYGVYALSFVYHFLGGAPEWCKSHALLANCASDAEWSIVAGRQGKIAVINLSSNIHSTSGATVIGQTGMIEWDSPFNRSDKVKLYKFASREQASAKFSYRNMGFEFQLEEVTRALKEGALESFTLSHEMTFETLKFSELVQIEAFRAQSSSA